MKKAIALILIFVFVLGLFACNNTPDNSSSSSSSEASQESTSSSSEESSSEPESSVVETSSEESSSESESSEESSTESTTESESSSVIITVTESGGFSSAITKVGKSNDRMKQMAWSNTIYGKGVASGYDDTKLSSILKSAQFIKAGGALVNYKNASAFMSHYLGNTGEDYIIDMKSFLSDENALYTRDAELNKALRACEELAIKGEEINVYQKEELVHHNLQGDWHYAIGSYFTSIEITNLTTTGRVYTATFTYKITDFYNWDEAISSPVFSGMLATLTSNVSPKDFAQLHRDGQAKDFLSKGEISYTVSWAQGQTVSEIIPFND